MNGVVDPGLWHEVADSRERQEFASSVRAHLGARFGPDAARACFDADPTAEAWGDIADAEYTRIGLPESMGGAGTLVDTVAMIEAAAHELVPLPLVSTVMAWQTLAAIGSSGAVAPDRIAALGVVGESDAETFITGHVAVLDGALAQELVLVDVRAPSIAAGVPGAKPDDVHRHVDPSRPLAVFDRERLSLAPIAESAFGADQLLAPARTVLAADLVGIAAAALDRAVQHAKDREQFGKKIGAFQGVKHRLADTYVAVERARSLTKAAAVTFAGSVPGDVSGTELSLLAKAAASEAAVDGTRAYVQVLGAMGMTFEADAHLYFRRAQQTAPILGSAEACYRRAVVTRQERTR